MEAVAGTTVALELVDVDNAKPMPEIVASNVFHRRVAFAPSTHGATVASATAELALNGQAIATTAVDLNRAQTVWQLAQLLGAVGHSLQPGDRLSAAP